jgi:NOL1/NOP2/fmu family ribosome biogenesis protein
LWRLTRPEEREQVAQKPEGRRKSREKPARLPARALSGYLDFCEQVGVVTSPVDRLALVGSYLYQTPEAAPSLVGLKAIHPGLWLGTHKAGEGQRFRFVPAHALALYLKPEHVARTVHLDHSQAIQYLQGLTFEHPGEEGWVLVCFDRFSLGWGRRVNAVVKNYYPKGLRWKST